MQTIHRSSISEDYVYYRTGSAVFFDYYRHHTSLRVEKITGTSSFFVARRLFPGIWRVDCQKTDRSPTPEELASHGIHRGMIFWTPLRETNMPEGWRQLSQRWTRNNIHSSRSAFTVLDNIKYFEKWKPSARAHRRKFLEYRSEGVLHIESGYDLETFLLYYTQYKTHNPYHAMVGKITKKLLANTTHSYRIYLGTLQDTVVAGAIFLDMGTTSEYWASFYAPESYPYHFGVGMMDRWMEESYQMGIRYADLDHMQDIGQDNRYQGYTQFKSAFADYDVFFHDAWFRFFSHG